MVFFKKVEVRCQKDRYGGTQRGLFALEPIAKGERIWFCYCGDKDATFTRAQLLAIIDKHAHLDYFIRSFSYMVDDDLYALPHTYLEEKNNDECSLFNHSCEPTCGLHAFGDNVVAVRDIDVGEELTYHYGVLETEASLIRGMTCKCTSKTCVGTLTFDYYRDPDFVGKYFDFMTPYLKQKVIDMKHRWYSSDCYVKRFPVTISSLSSSTSSSSSNSPPSASRAQHAIYPNDSTSTASSSSSSNSSSSSEDINELIENEPSETPLALTTTTTTPPPAPAASSSCEYEKGLASLTCIKKGQLVAKFAEQQQQPGCMVEPGSHFIRNSATPTCVVDIDGNVFALDDIGEDVEITIDYHALPVVTPPMPLLDHHAS